MSWCECVRQARQASRLGPCSAAAPCTEAPPPFCRAPTSRLSEEAERGGLGPHRLLLEQRTPPVQPQPLHASCRLARATRRASHPIPPQVTIYRLLSKGTYEENVFQISSRKYGEPAAGQLGPGAGWLGLGEGPAEGGDGPLRHLAEAMQQEKHQGKGAALPFLGPARGGPTTAPALPSSPGPPGPSPLPHPTTPPPPGLDEAILGGLGASDSGNPEDDSKKIAELLRHGAHCLQAPDAANEQVRAGVVAPCTGRAALGVRVGCT